MTAATKIQTLYRKVSAQRKYKKSREITPAFSIKARIRQINRIGVGEAFSPEKTGRRLSNQSLSGGHDAGVRSPELGSNTRPLPRPRQSLSPAPPPTVAAEGGRSGKSPPLRPQKSHPHLDVLPSTAETSPSPNFRRRTLRKEKGNVDNNANTLRSKLYASRSSAHISRNIPAEQVQQNPTPTTLPVEHPEQPMSPLPRATKTRARCASTTGGKMAVTGSSSTPVLSPSPKMAVSRDVEIQASGTKKDLNRTNFGTRRSTTSRVSNLASLFESKSKSDHANYHSLN